MDWTKVTADALNCTGRRVLDVSPSRLEFPVHGSHNARLRVQVLISVCL